MSIEIKAPTLGESVSEIYVGKWYKAPGDPVAKDEPLVELESDKATLDLPAAEAGKLAEILRPSGSTVEVGEVLALLDNSAVAERAKPAPTNGATPAQAKVDQPPPAESRGSEPPAPQPPAPEPSEPASKEPAASRPTESGEPRGQRTEAEETTTTTETPPPRTEPAATQATARVPARPASPPARTNTQATPPIVQRDWDPAETSMQEQNPERLVERVPMSPVRRRIALRLVDAQQQAALLTTFNEADMSAVKQLRSELGDAFEKKHGVRLGFMPFFVKAAVAALEQFPQINAVIEDNEIIYRRFYDVGIAVSTAKGLVVPVLRNAERMTFAEIERAIGDFATRARDGALKVDDLQGGTFTITNGGIFGSLMSTPIVNPPQSGVLGMHVIQDRPIAHGGEVVIRPMMYLALTYDHRMVDGREAVLFLTQIKQAIENPSRLLLDI